MRRWGQLYLRHDSRIKDRKGELVVGVGLKLDTILSNILTLFKTTCQQRQATRLTRLKHHKVLKRNESALLLVGYAEDWNGSASDEIRVKWRSVLSESEALLRVL